jgi:hypothetical protein
MDVDGVVASLLALKDAFPRANASAMAAKHPALLRASAAELRARAEQFKRVLLEQGGDDPDALAQVGGCWAVDGMHPKLAAAARCMGPGVFEISRNAAAPPPCWRQMRAQTCGRCP